MKGAPAKPPWALEGMHGIQEAGQERGEQPPLKSSSWAWHLQRKMSKEFRLSCHVRGAE